MKRLQQKRHALGSDVLFTIVVEDSFISDEIFNDMWAETTVFENTFSRFLPDSELSYVNQNSGTKTEVSQEFVGLIKTAKKYSLATGGLYTPFILPALQSAGYKGSWPDPDTFAVSLDYSARHIVTVNELEIGEDYIKIPPASALDFGGIGKGYLLDQLGLLLKRQKVPNYWLSLGGDILFAGQDIGSRNWKIAIQGATSTSTVGEVENKSGGVMAIATSGTTKRRGVNSKGEQWHHLIDPRTARPANSDVLTATVCSESATMADIYAKCIIILGSEKGTQFLESHRVGSALLQITTDDDTIKLYKTGDITL